MYGAGRYVQCACDSWIVVWCSALRISSGLACGGYGSAVGSVVLRAHRPGRPVRFAAHRQPLCWNSCTIHELFCL